jgi:hypothetical protein
MEWGSTPPSGDVLRTQYRRIPNRNAESGQ